MGEGAPLIMMQQQNNNPNNANQIPSANNQVPSAKQAPLKPAEEEQSELLLYLLVIEQSL